MAKPIIKRASLALPFILTFASGACSKSPVSKAEDKHSEDPVVHRNPPPMPVPAEVAVSIDAGAQTAVDSGSLDSGVPLDAGVLQPTKPQRHRPIHKNPPRVLRKPPINKNPPSPRSNFPPIVAPKTD